MVDIAITAELFIDSMQTIEIWNLFQIKHKSLTLGEVLDGDRMAFSLYNISFKGTELLMQMPKNVCLI